MSSKSASTSRKNSVRIIGGQWRSRRIAFPDRAGLRPTSDRVRETLFNWLQLDIPGGSCLDLFAGSGALGFEALSRGASFVQFVEQDEAVARAIESGLATLACTAAAVEHGSADSFLARIPRPATAVEAPPYDVVFLDPPFSDNRLLTDCQRLQSSEAISPGSKIYMESGTVVDEDSLPGNWEIIKSKRAGNTHFYLAEVRQSNN